MEGDQVQYPDPASSVEAVHSTVEIEQDSSPDLAKPIDVILPIIEIGQKQCDADAQCPVCTDKFALGCKVRQLTCNHLYHSDCIIPWLVRRNTCPVCRLELPPLSGVTKEDDISGSTGGISGSTGGIGGSTDGIAVNIVWVDHAHDPMWPVDSY